MWSLDGSRSSHPWLWACRLEPSLRPLHGLCSPAPRAPTTPPAPQGTHHTTAYHSGPQLLWRRSSCHHSPSSTEDCEAGGEPMFWPISPCPEKAAAHGPCSCSDTPGSGPIPVWVEGCPGCQTGACMGQIGSPSTSQQTQHFFSCLVLGRGWSKGSLPCRAPASHRPWALAGLGCLGVGALFGWEDPSPCCPLTF